MNRSLQILIALLYLVASHSLSSAQSDSLTAVKLLSPCKTNGESTLKKMPDIVESVPSRVNPGLDPVVNKGVDAVKTSKPLEVEFDGLDGDKRFVLTELCDKGVFSGPDIVDVKGLESALREMLLAVGYPYAQVRISFDQQSLLSVFVDKGVRVHLAEIQFEGNKFVSNQQLLPIVRGCLKRIGEGDTWIYNDDMVEYCGRSLRKHLWNLGYLQAKVIRKTEVTDVGYQVSFTMEEGPRYRLGKISINGSKALTEDQIREKLQLREGEIASGGQIAKWLDEDVKKVYADIGFIEYIAHPIPTFRQEHGIVDFEVEIDEGKKFTWRSITFSGHAVEGFDPENLLLFRVGDSYSDGLFRESVARINNLRLFAPIDPDRDVYFRTDQQNALVAVTIKLNKQE